MLILTDNQGIPLTSSFSNV